MNQDDRQNRRIILEASKWISRIESGELKERQPFIAWMSQDEAHQRAVEQLMLLSRALRGLPPAVWADVKAAVDARPTNVVPLHAETHRAPPRRRRGVVPLAACSLIGIATYIATCVAGTSYETAYGENRIVALDDGSRVHLNSQTLVVVRFTGHERSIKLVHGEALFDVVQDASRGLRVAVGEAAIQSLGTQCDVSLHGNDLAVTVKRGHVALLTHQKESTPGRIEIGPEESITLNLADRHPSPHVQRLGELTTQQVMAWTGWVTLWQMPLKEAVARFNRANSTQIVVDDPALSALRLGGNLSIIRPDDFVDALVIIGVGVSRSSERGHLVFHLVRHTSSGSAPKPETSRHAVHEL